MRDVDKLKEKIELSLDNRQVVSLVIGTLVVLGVVFVLGVMVGKQLATPTGTNPPPQDVLAALDKAPMPPLTFPTELKQPIVDPTPPKVEKVEAKADKVEKSEKLAADKADKVDKTAKVEPNSPTLADTSEPKTDKVEKSDKAEKTDKPEKSDKFDPTPYVKVEAVKLDPKSDAKVADAAPAPAPALDKKLADAFTAAKNAPKPAQPASVTPPSSGFTVQVAASQQKSEADEVAAKLRGNGLSPYLVDADIPGRGRWYRVRVGSFRNRDDAEKYVRDLKRETGLSGFVTSAR